MLELFDSHAHVDGPEFDADREDVLARARAAGVKQLVVIGAVGDPTSAERAVALAERDPDVWATVATHPHDVARMTPAWWAVHERLAWHPRVVAIGETGLDYFRVEGDTGWQRERFRAHIRAAREAGKPLVIHTRAAAEDTLRIMREERAGEAGGVMHCFTETWEVAQAAMDLGFLISFSGIVTFKNAQALRDVAIRVPLDRMLVETDSPYLAPVPHRGKPNEPAWVRHVAEEVARLRGIAFEEVARATTANFFGLFRDARPA
jgi:TatD DNase family protein